MLEVSMQTDTATSMSPDHPGKTPTMPSHRKIFLSICLLLISGSTSFAQSGPSQDLFDAYGLRLGVAAHPHFSGKDVVVVTEVAQGSAADASDLVAGAMILTLEGRLQGPVLNADRYDAETYSAEILSYLESEPFVLGAFVDFEGYASRPLNAVMEWQRTAQKPFIFPKDLVTNHLGLRVASGGLVTEVSGPSPATRAGLEPGDKITSLGGGAIVGSTSEAHFLKQLFRRIVSFDEILDIRVERNGHVEILQMEPLPLGETVPGGLDAEVEAVFALLPDVLRPMFTSLYRGDFETTYQYQMATFRRFYQASAASLVLPALGLDDRTRARAANARLEAFMAQYILIKSNWSGLCGEPYETFEVSETIIETTRDGYGIELSSEIISHYEGEYAVPVRFLQVVLHAEPIREFSELSEDVRNFIDAAGGCDSAILGELEDQMIAYLDYQPD